MSHFSLYLMPPFFFHPGKASIVFDDKNSVFYNNVQEFNRDISSLAINLFIQKRKEEEAERTDRKRRFDLGELKSWRKATASPWDEWFTGFFFSLHCADQVFLFCLHTTGHSH